MGRAGQARARQHTKPIGPLASQSELQADITVAKQAARAVAIDGVQLQARRQKAGRRGGEAPPLQPTCNQPARAQAIASAAAGLRLNDLIANDDHSWSRSELHPRRQIRTRSGAGTSTTASSGPAERRRQGAAWRLFTRNWQGLVCISPLDPSWLGLPRAEEPFGRAWRLHSCK